MLTSTTPLALTAKPCEHEAAESTTVGDDTITSAWECVDCGHLTPFTDEDHAFCNSSPWTPRAPEWVSPLTWLFTSREARLDFWARR